MVESTDLLTLAFLVHALVAEMKYSISDIAINLQRVRRRRLCRGCEKSQPTGDDEMNGCQCWPKRQTKISGREAGVFSCSPVSRKGAMLMPKWANLTQRSYFGKQVL